MKLLFNDAERYLIDKWADARSLEDSMEEVRKKYQEIGQRIVDSIKSAYSEFDFGEAFLTQRWANGYIAFSKRAWSGGGGNSPPGLYVDHLRLELLTSHEEDPPTVYIWVPKSAKIDPKSVRVALEGIAKRELSSDEFQQVNFDEPGEVSFAAPSREELRSALLKGDGQGFVDLVVKQIEGMARFIPGLDELFARTT